jgi:hypothetical protein
MARSITRRNASVLSFVAIMISMFVVALVALTQSPSQADTTPSPTLCTTPDGRDSELCWFHDARSGWILNVNHGAYSLVLDTGDTINGLFEGK